MPSYLIPPRLRALSLFLVSLFLLVLSPRASAHAPTFAVYSKYEATVADHSVAVVFAFDKTSVLQLLTHDAVHRTAEVADVEGQLPFFSRYLFDRFSIANDGAACAHPDSLNRFFWDEQTGRILAVAKFTCAAKPNELHIHSLVTHDMPTSHELVGDLAYNGALIRNLFVNDETEADIALATLKPGMENAVPKRRGRITYVPMPDRVRRYDALASEVLGVNATHAASPANADDARAGEDGPDDAKPSAGASLLHFIGEGIKHIFTGYDHVLFIVTLIFAVGTWRKLAVIVTSFTAAHSITLILATLGVITLPSAIVEPLIAATVLYVAVDAVLRPNASTRAGVTFGFGLLHGFGLSTVLRDLGLHGRELVPALLGFNLGVEIGQLLIVAPLFPLILMLRRREATYARTRSVLCASVAVIATMWIVARVWEAFRA